MVGCPCVCCIPVERLPVLAMWRGAQAPAVSKLYSLQLPSTDDPYVCMRCVSNGCTSVSCASFIASLQADNVLRGKPGSGSQSRGGQGGAKSILFDGFARYLSFVHFAVFCLLSWLKAVVSTQHDHLLPAIDLRMPHSLSVLAFSALEVLVTAPCPRLVASLLSRNNVLECHESLSTQVDSTALPVPILSCFRGCNVLTVLAP